MKRTIILKKSSNGFTLIEIMVAVSIFAMVMVVGIGSVLSIVSANKKAQAYNAVITNLSFALEGMMRDLRTGYNYDCNADGTPGDCSTSSGVMSTPADKIGLTSSQYDAPVVYGLETTGTKGHIYKTVNGVKSQVTSDDVNIDKLRFYVVNTLKPVALDNVQPRILIIISGKYGGYGQEARFNLQTTVSQRRLDIDD